MLEEQVTKKRILDKSHEMFQNFGYSKVTMEEIAQNLGISKKTLYKFFSNKKHILTEVISSVKCEVEQKFEKVLSDENSDFIQKLQGVFDIIGENVKYMQGHFTSDIILNHPEIWSEIQEFKRKKSHVQFSRLIEQGMREGFIKSDISSQLTVLVYSAALREIMVPDILSQIPMSKNQVYHEIIKMLFEGILSEKGRFRYINLQFDSKDKSEVF